MKITPTRIAGVMLVEMERHHDERGWFTRTWCAEEFRAHGLEPALVQCSSSFNRKCGTLRGMHYQAEPHGETKLVRCTRGAVFDVAVDVRRSSPTFGRWVGVELTAENHRQLWVPAGMAHGFVVLSEYAEFLYKTTDYYQPSAERSILWNDPTLAIDWELAEPPQLSAKDQVGKLLMEADLFP